jgi:hypothetical protein
MACPSGSTSSSTSSASSPSSSDSCVVNPPSPSPKGSSCTSESRSLRCSINFVCSIRSASKRPGRFIRHNVAASASAYETSMASCGSNFAKTACRRSEKSFSSSPSMRINFALVIPCLRALPLLTDFPAPVRGPVLRLELRRLAVARAEPDRPLVVCIDARHAHAARRLRTSFRTVRNPPRTQI